MAATKQEIAAWFDEGVRKGHEYMLVVCDTWDYEDYPVFADGVNFWDQYNSHHEVNMTCVVEVYDLHKDKAEQLATPRVNNYPLMTVPVLPTPAPFVPPIPETPWPFAPKPPDPVKGILDKPLPGCEAT